MIDSIKLTNWTGNKGLCGAPLKIQCNTTATTTSSSSRPKPSSTFGFVGRVAIAVGVSLVIGGAVLATRRTSHEQLRRPPSSSSSHNSSKGVISKEENLESGPDLHAGSTAGKKPTRDHDQGRLMFVREDTERFELQDLLKSSAEVMGAGHLGCSYKATLMNGPSMVVKRLRDMNRVGKEDFEEHMRRLGRLSHPNLLPLVAYYYRKEEKLLVTEYAAHRSLAYQIYGDRGTNNAILDWPTRLKIVKGVTRGLAYLYNELSMLTVPHGHLKSSNVLLNQSFEPLLTDYALTPVMNQSHAAQYMAAYKSPERKQFGRMTKKSDVWTLGLLILEILTGKPPVNESSQGKVGGCDLVNWINSVAESEWSAQVFDSGLKETKNGEGEMVKLMKIGLACCEGNVDKRWEITEAVNKIEELMEKEEDGVDFASIAMN